MGGAALADVSEFILEVSLFNKTSDRYGPTDDGPHPLTTCPKPDAQGAAPKVSFAVLRSQVARPGFGHEQSLNAFSQAAASG